MIGRARLLLSKVADGTRLKIVSNLIGYSTILIMDEKKRREFTAEFAKGIKTKADVNQLTSMHTQLTVENVSIN
ncbi:hypothetical protein [Providencia rettgeri]|uniref:hypothetical protein n=1 Tax=Providencia rettgeri TaxID=587 RepID=UPI0034E05B13